MKRAILAIAAIATALPVSAAVGTEHFFTNALAVAEGQTEVEGTFDVYNWTGDDAPHTFYLYANGYTSSIIDASTGLGDHWNDFLRHGYLTVERLTQTGDAYRNRLGMRTKSATYKVMDSTLGSATVCTIYTVFRPRPDMGWGSGNRNTLWGFGHTGESTIKCYHPQSTDPSLLLEFVVKNGNPGNQTCTLKLDPGESGWKDAWYLVAASFPGTAGESSPNPMRFWMRELDPRGPYRSPDPITSQFVTGGNHVTYYPAAKNKWPFPNANGSGCMGIGAYFYNPGANGGNIDGLGGDICYFRTENTYQTEEDFNAFFLSLGLADPPTTVVLIR